MADIDPKQLSPGTVMRHRSGGTVTLDRRKENDSGWWNTDGSGLIDSAFASSDWTVEWRPADQDPEYLAAAHAAMAAALDPEVATVVLEVLAEAGWHLITAEDAEKMVNAYVMQALR